MAYQYEYPRPAVSADIIVFNRQLPSAKRRILLIQRLRGPFADCWALPGGFMEINETIEETARRELLEETGLVITDAKQIGTFSAVDRDPRGRVLSVAFVADLDGDVQASAADDAKSVDWFELDSLPALAFDHADMIEMALKLTR